MSAFGGKADMASADSTAVVTDTDTTTAVSKSHSPTVLHDERRTNILDSLRRREAALISTSDGKRIITQLSFNIPNLATIRS
jgi:hypothetical protein